MNVTYDQFHGALGDLEVLRARSGEYLIGPIDEPVVATVAHWLAELLVANPALAAHLALRFEAVAPEDGVRTLPVRELLGALEVTARHGAPAQPPTPGAPT